MITDLREVIKSLMGETSSLFPNQKQAIGFQWYGLRQPDYTRKCSCDGTLGTNTNSTCKRCLSTGYLFTDFLIKGYSWMGLLGVEYGTMAGKLSTQQRNLVVKHNRVINKFDFILELAQDSDTGIITQPFKIVRQFKIQDIIPIKGDSGRIEFWKCTIEERNVDDGRPGIEGNTYNYQGNRSNNEPQ
jgi:hypothetical protein